jgi:hypothetical protein
MAECPKNDEKCRKCLMYIICDNFGSTGEKAEKDYNALDCPDKAGGLRERHVELVKKYDKTLSEMTKKGDTKDFLEATEEKEVFYKQVLQKVQDIDAEKTEGGK